MPASYPDADADAGPATKTGGAASTPARRDLRADCSRCVGLCCVALPFSRSADFPVDKAAGDPCDNLAPDHRCTIHTLLRERGYVGCTVFDCFGAGQRVTAAFAGRTWRDDAAPGSTGTGTGTVVFAAFGVVRQLHEMLWYLAEVAELDPARPLRADALALARETERLAALPPEALGEVDVAAHRSVVGPLLGRASALVRADARRRLRLDPRTDRPGADLMGRRLRGADLRAVDLRGAYLVGADLAGADLRFAGLLGADLRGADLSGARLDDALFLTQPQVAAARGDGRTRLPRPLRRPGHWAPAPRRP